jgi:hypothetical protein
LPCYVSTSINLKCIIGFLRWPSGSFYSTPDFNSD